MTAVRTRGVVTSLLIAAAVAGCGGGSDGDDDGRRAATTSTSLSPTAPAPPPDEVDGADVAVVRLWASTLQRGDVAAAARLFALPSAVANGSRPIALSTRAQVRAFNRSLPCGADVLSARAAARGFIIVTFRLTERPGGDCGSGTGNTARAAFHVTDGLIDHWLRVEDLEAPPAEGTPS